MVGPISQLLEQPVRDASVVIVTYNALPWIVFRRDRLQFEREFPDWSLERVEPLMPVRFLLSGGTSLRSLMPGFSFGLWRLAEKAVSPIMEQVAMFALIVLRRR